MSQNIYDSARKKLARTQIGRYNEEDKFEEHYQESEEKEHGAGDQTMDNTQRRQDEDYDPIQKKKLNEKTAQDKSVSKDSYTLNDLLISFVIHYIHIACWDA